MYPALTASVSSSEIKENSGGRDQEDHGLKPAQANSSQDPISEKALVEWLKV
jgi:hypothetical protein